MYIYICIYIYIICLVRDNFLKQRTFKTKTYEYKEVTLPLLTDSIH
jgi:hypothetical protein